ncbi:hypothetical protein B488_04430 [Liberibacter crescens BT-1]|uniref:Uncharacterized protein n=1 Tax=Liberibacter crescens (strain BT-1) TaxID=1215343 RepID=L0EUA7_LIBCB|nr:hypothetical protein [Liberibacter crescens]AGA64435.1 hypothetical protein B488_04430 [Liberibacter crescens BT-1]
MYSQYLIYLSVKMRQQRWENMAWRWCYYRMIRSSGQQARSSTS